MYFLRFQELYIKPRSCILWISEIALKRALCREYNDDFMVINAPRDTVRSINLINLNLDLDLSEFRVRNLTKLTTLDIL